MSPLPIKIVNTKLHCTWWYAITSYRLRKSNKFGILTFVTFIVDCNY